MRRWTIALVIAVALGAAGFAPAAPPDAPSTPPADVYQSAGASMEASAVPWTLMAGVVMFFMQAGFALVETGMVRAKNATHTMAINVIVFCVGALGFWLCGYAILFGAGWEGVCLSGKTLAPGFLALFLVHVMFMDTAVTIPTGAMAERWKLLPFVLFAFFMSMIVYPVYGSWVWGHDGWLSRLGTDFGLGHGVKDFAGSSVVHMTGGGAALAGAYLIGPRLGKFRPDGRPNPLPAHNVPLYLTGVLFLIFGWFGFDMAQALAASDTICARVAVNTLLASAAAAFASICYTWVSYKKPDPSFLCNGALAGLVSITAGCAYVPPWAAVLIGAVAGVLVINSCLFVERRLKIDDPVGAISVHGACGVWGVLAVGLFADGAHPIADPVRGLFFGGGAGQLAAQAVAVAVNVLWVLPTCFGFFWLVRQWAGLRVGPMAEMQGLDVPELGTIGYMGDDAKFPESRFLAHRPTDPRPASAPPDLGRRFTVRIDGMETAILRVLWSDMCQIGDLPPSPYFKAVYPYMTTMQDNLMRFRGGDPETIRVSVERLFQERAKGHAVRAALEP